MTRAALVLAVLAVSGADSGAQSPSAALDLVGTWTLAIVEQNVESGTPARVQNPRGLLVFDAAGHVIEVVTRATPAAAGGLSDAQSRFLGFGGSWGGYRADLGAQTITYSPRGAVSPNVMGSVFTRTFELRGDRLTITSRPGELHTRGVTRWVWERVPTVDNLSPGYRRVIGFWEHVVEKRINAATGAVVAEDRRAPSVIVYTPAGYVGVHFPPLNRQRFADAEPTDAEARAALMGYVGYFGALALYPGMVFHHIMAGLSPAARNTLKRSYELSGDELTIRFAPVANPQGPTTTLVTLRRLSGEADMLPPRRP